MVLSSRRRTMATTATSRRGLAAGIMLSAATIASAARETGAANGLEEWLAANSTHMRRADTDEDGNGYFNPNENGGSMLTKVEGTYPEGQGEPVNVIISGYSDSEVLDSNEDKGGIINYFLSLHFSGECLGQHAGSSQQVNLGDGNDYLNETAVMRWNYFEPELGACTESINGGNHFRYWQQNGDDAQSNAYFLAVSYELPISKGHDIVTNGYNLARDQLVGNITNTTVPTLELTNSSTLSEYSGYTFANGWTYYTDVKYLSGGPGLAQNTSLNNGTLVEAYGAKLLDNSSYEINHNWSVQVSSGPGKTNAVDGLVALLKVSVHERPPGSGAASDRIPASITWLALPLLVAMSTVLATLSSS